MSDIIEQLLVTGGNGRLGTELERYAWPEDWVVTAVDIDEHDLRDTAAMVAEGYDSWAAVIFAGAYTAANQAENNGLLIAWASMRWFTAFAEHSDRPGFDRLYLKRCAQRRRSSQR